MHISIMHLTVQERTDLAMTQQEMEERRSAPHYNNKKKAKRDHFNRKNHTTLWKDILSSYLPLIKQWNIKKSTDFF